MTTETLNFSADVSRLLDIVANALYTSKDVFLRELISNAADACDKLRFESIRSPALAADNPIFRLHIYKDTQARTLTVLDNGIGMTHDELRENLGTIAKSGTAALMQKVNEAGNDADPLKLIGQFGVGFYASFMVADKVRVVSRRAGADDIWTWESDGRTGFTLRAATPDESALLDGQRGTAVVLHLKDESPEYLLDDKLAQTINQYSDHIDTKIYLNPPQDTARGEGHPVNSASAIWTRPKTEVSKEQYVEFYRYLTHGFDEPLLTAHWHAEGKIEYKALLFIPTLRPFNLYDPSRSQSVSLYVRRVFITDNAEGLIYPWLRFLRGVVDSADLPLNISRETLQMNPLLAKIRTGIANRILSDLDRLSRDDIPAFLTFWGQFGPAIKEGLYDAHDHREGLFKICRFFSTHNDGEIYVSLDDYIARMKPGQKEIYYISGESAQALKNSPQTEGFKSRGIEVLFFTDTIDDFWLQQVQDYKGHAFKSVTKGDIDFGAIEGTQDKPDDSKTETAPADMQDLLSAMRALMSGQVQDVRISRRLTDSPVCLVAPESGIDMNMERVLKIHQKYEGETLPILEINAGHPLIAGMNAMQDKTSGVFEDAALLLLDQARIVQGQPVKNPAAFARRMSAFMKSGL